VLDRIENKRKLGGIPLKGQTKSKKKSKNNTAFPPGTDRLNPIIQKKKMTVREQEAANANVINRNLIGGEDRTERIKVHRWEKAGRVSERAVERSQRGAGEERWFHVYVKNPLVAKVLKGELPSTARRRISPNKDWGEKKRRIRRGNGRRMHSRENTRSWRNKTALKHLSGRTIGRRSSSLEKGNAESRNEKGAIGNINS